MLMREIGKGIYEFKPENDEDRAELAKYAPQEETPLEDVPADVLKALVDLDIAELETTSTGRLTHA